MGVKSEHSNTSTPRDLGRYKNVKSKVASAYSRYNTPNTKETAPDVDKVKGLASGRRWSKSKNSDRGIEGLKVSKKDSSDSDSENGSSDESEEKKNTNMKLTSAPARRMHKLLAVTVEMDCAL